MKLIGIDIGGTHTRIRVGATDHAQHTDTRLNTADWLTPGGLADPDAAAALLDHAAAIGSAPDAALAVGAHGCDSPAQITEFHDALRIHHHGPLTVVNDAALLAPAAGVRSAVGVIAGTGSIVVGHAATTTITAGGHGWIIGDPGSAPGIAREAVKATLLRFDQGLEPDLLAQQLMRRFAVDHPEDLAAAFLRGATIHAWAQAAPTVFSAADAGSATAAAVIDLAARELAASVRHVLDRGADADAVVTAGGVVVNQPRLQDALRTELRAAGVALPLIVLDVAPVAGALELARRAALAPAPIPDASYTAPPPHSQGGTP